MLLLPTEFHRQILSSRIMIVEDSDMNRIFLQKILEKSGYYNLLTVSSAEEALERMLNFNPELVILDIIMPGMDGFECCHRIRQQCSYDQLPVLIQTSITEPEARVKAFEMGATDFISKPVYPQELCARVKVHLENRHGLKNLQLFRNRIEIELESARQLQQSILPGTNELDDIERLGFDIASYFQPSSEIGGDFWGTKILFPHQTALWIVDFSGHGVASALNAFRLQAYLKEHSPLMARPGEYLSHLNDKLLHLLLRGQFATMFYGIVDTQTNQLFYACACSPHPIIRRNSDGQCELLDGSGSLLGIGMHFYSVQSTSFKPGDTLFLYSDALVETPNANGEFISEKEIMTLMVKHKGASSAGLKEILLDYFNEHTGGTMFDDLTFIIYSRQVAF